LTQPKTKFSGEPSPLSVPANWPQQPEEPKTRWHNPTPLFQRGTQTGPLAPAVAAEIAAAENALATLEAGRGEAALSAMTEGGDVNALCRA